MVLLCRVAFAAGAMLIIPGTGLTLQAQPSANDKVGVAIATMPKRTTVAGAAQEGAPAAKAAGKPADSGRDGGSELKRAEDRLDWAERMFSKGYVSKAQLVAERLNLQRVKSRRAVALADAQAANDVVTIQGIVRDKSTGKPLPRIQVSADAPGASTKTDENGRFELSRLPARERYSLLAACVSGEPYLITSRVVERTKGKDPLSADLEMVRGIPFRISILDAATGKPISGGMSYFPLYPNNPIERGVLGYTAGPGMTAGAFYEASSDNKGQFRGAVLPGRGILCFQQVHGKWSWKKGEREPALFSPDGPDIIKVERATGGEPFVHGNPISSSNPPLWGGLGLAQYPAVIAINPKEDTREIIYELRIRDPNQSAQ
jgi:hypothetical protein